MDNKPVGQNPWVIRLMKGVFNKRPSIPKTNVTWNPEILLNYVKKLSPVKSITFTELTHKLVALLWILVGQRAQGLHLIDCRNITLSDHTLKIHYGDLLKQTRPGFQQQELLLKAYAPDRRLDIVLVMKEYLKRTKIIRGGENHLFIATQKPHKAVSKDTISRWIKRVMGKSGLDVTIFTPHSVRSASTSAALKVKVPLQTILNTAGWSSKNTFRKYYNKPITDNVYAQNILAKFGKNK